MKKHLISAAAAAALFAVCLAWTCLSSSPAAAQPPGSGTPTARGTVALVDISFILKNHVRLADEKKRLKAEADAVQKDFEQQAQSLQERARKVAAFKVGSPEYNEGEETLNKEKAAMQTAFQHKRREFVQREAHLMYNAYIEISQYLRTYCEARGISVVINFDHESIRDDSPDNVARAFSNPVLYFNRDFDITPDIMPPFVKPLPPSGPAAFTPPTQR